MKRVFLTLVILLVAGLALHAQEQQQAPDLKHVATLVSDASRDETIILVDSGAAVVVDKDMIIESRDGKVRETRNVKHVYNNHVVLKTPLSRPFLTGSRLYQ